MAKPILVSGIQPTGRLHIGNYLGALKNFVELQNSGKYDCFFFIADLHSLTEEFNPKEKQRQILELVADFLAVGLDPKRSKIYLQSQIPAQVELGWIFETLVPMAELYRMTQFKSKSDAQKQNVNVGLLTYPALMASDILIYSPKFVPVGHDQLQHLELTRTLARKFNARFGKTFIEPQALLTLTPRVMSLSNPEKKMSKSHPESCLFIDDKPEEILSKVKRAVTDSGSEIKYDLKMKPAISNLISIYATLSGKNVEVVEKKFSGSQYSAFKIALGELIADHFANFRKKKAALIKKPKALASVLKAGSKRAAKVANKKILEVKKKIGVAL